MERRKHAGYTQESLAEKLGVSRQAVSKWERSESSPDTDNLIALAQLYGVSLDELLFAEAGRGEALDELAVDLGEDDGPDTGDGSDAGSNAGDDSDAGSDACGSNGTGVNAGGGAGVCDGPDASYDSDADPNAGADSGVAGEDPFISSDAGDEIHLSSNALHLKSSSGEEVVLAKGGGVVMRDAAGSITRGFEGLREAHDAWNADHGREPRGYTVHGERFETLDAAREKYGADIDAGEPVQKHYSSRFMGAWNRFPYPLIALLGAALPLVYGGAPSVAISVASNYHLFIWPSDIALLWIATIPLYYLLGRAIDRRRPLSFIAEAYAIAAMVLMVPVIGQGLFGITWPLLLTVPLVAWLAHACERRAGIRKSSRTAGGTDAGNESASASDNA